LRGGIARDEAWARTPDQPLIAISTVDQVGSRLLFRGYGVTDSMKPVHAGLLGHDVLYLLDEVHLSNPFCETLAAIGGTYRGWSERPLPGTFTVVEMSATPGRVPMNPFRLSDADHAHPRLAQRLRTAKRTRLVATTPKGFAKEVEKHARPMLEQPGATVAMVVNRVKSARELHASLRESLPDGPNVAHLLTGRMRPFDRDAIERSLLSRIRSGRASLGVLAAVDGGPSPPTLRWRHEGLWNPVLTSIHADLDSLIDHLDDDRLACVQDHALRLSYDGKRDLKPPPRVFRNYLLELSGTAAPANRRSVDWAAAFATDVAVDNNGNTKPTALHFTAGQQQFLQMVEELVTNVTKDDMREAMEGPWAYRKPLPVMGWDATSSRDYALRASDPSTDKKLGVPGADWLAVRGLAFFPCVPVGQRIATTRCAGGWKNGSFSWPLWTVALTSSIIRTLLRLDIEGMRRTERTARGVGAVLRAGIRRSDQGGYGSFEPSSAI
jgi:hypothetical protein